jgi:hypothetical protein
MAGSECVKFSEYTERYVTHFTWERTLHQVCVNAPTIHTTTSTIYYTFHMKIGVHYHECIRGPSGESAAWKISYIHHMRKDALRYVCINAPSVHPGTWKISYTLHMREGASCTMNLCMPVQISLPFQIFLTHITRKRTLSTTSQYMQLQGTLIHERLFTGFTWKLMLTTKTAWSFKNTALLQRGFTHYTWR